MYIDIDTGQPVSAEEQDMAELNPAFYTWVRPASAPNHHTDEA